MAANFAPQCQLASKDSIQGATGAGCHPPLTSAAGPQGDPNGAVRAGGEGGQGMLRLLPGLVVL